MAQRILVVDDEPNIRDVICFALGRAGHETVSARNGAEALQAVRRGGIDMLVLDVGMPEMDGLEVCRQLRRSSGVPILFLSARSEEIDRVLGLELGGDDYVTKPFSPRELVARVNAILKRSNPEAAARPGTPLRAGAVALDTGRHAVSYGGHPVALTGVEFSMVAVLLARPGVVFPREQLMHLAYGGSTYVSDRTIDSHIRNIRAKFAAVGCQNIVATVHGVGFKLGLEDGGG